MYVVCVCVCACRQLRDAREQRLRLESRIHNLQQQLAAATMAAAIGAPPPGPGGARMATRQQGRDMLMLERERVADQQVCWQGFAAVLLYCSDAPRLPDQNQI